MPVALRRTATVSVLAAMLATLPGGLLAPAASATPLVAVSGMAVSGAAVSGAAVFGAAVSGAAVSGAAVSEAAVSAAATSRTPVRPEPVADVGGVAGTDQVPSARDGLDVQPPPAFAAGALAGTLALLLVLAGPVVGALAGLTVISRPSAPGAPTPRRRRSGALG